MNNNKTIIKLHYFNQRMNAIYKDNGFNSIPLYKNDMKPLIETSQKDIRPLFMKCFGSMGNHFLDKFYNFRGNVFEFYFSLDSENQDKFAEFDW